MGADAIVGLGRMMLIQVATLVAPILALVVAVSFIINIIQVLVSLQDQTLSAVPRLLATGTTLFPDALDVEAPRALHHRTLF